MRFPSSCVVSSRKLSKRIPPTAIRSMRDFVVDLRRVDTDTQMWHRRQRSKPAPRPRRGSGSGGSGCGRRRRDRRRWTLVAGDEMREGAAVSSPADSIDSSPAVGQPVRRRQRRVLLRWHDGAADFEPCSGARAQGDLAHLGHAIQEDVEEPDGDRRVSLASMPSSRAPCVALVAECVSRRS